MRGSGRAHAGLPRADVHSVLAQADIAPGEREDLSLAQAKGLPGGPRALSSPGVVRTGHAAAAFRAWRSRERSRGVVPPQMPVVIPCQVSAPDSAYFRHWAHTGQASDPKSTRLNSSHISISYAVFTLKKNKKP